MIWNSLTQIEPVGTSQTWIELVRISWNQIELVWTHLNLMEPVEPEFTGWNLSELNWTGLNWIEPVWTRWNRIEQVGNDPSTVTTSTNQVPGNKPTKEKKDLYNENFKTPKKEIEEETRRWKIIPYSWFGRVHSMKMASLAKAIYGSNATPSKGPKSFLTDRKKTISKRARRYTR